MDSLFATWVGAIVAWLGVVVALVHARRSIDASNEANRIQREMLELQRDHIRNQAAKQSLSSWRSYLMGTGSERAVVVQNLGPAIARDVHILINGQPADRHPGVDKRRTFDVEELDVGATLHIPYVDLHSSPIVETVTVRWLDESDSQQSFVTSVR